MHHSATFHRPGQSVWNTCGNGTEAPRNAMFGRGPYACQEEGRGHGSMQATYGGDPNVFVTSQGPSDWGPQPSFENGSFNDIGMDGNIDTGAYQPSNNCAGTASGNIGCRQYHQSTSQLNAYSQQWQQQSQYPDGLGCRHDGTQVGDGGRGFDDMQQWLSELNDESDRLVAVRDLPAAFQPLFPNYRYFNPVQSECFKEAYESDVNMVVSAPTGSGKTGVMELALLRLLSGFLENGSGSAAAGSGGGGKLRPLGGTNKAVYVAPLRALVQEKCKDWQARFGARLGLSVLELTGDTEPEAAALEKADVLCTTPEKLDALSRKLSEQNRSATFLSDIRLVLIDEVHLLHEAERGSALEAGVVSRLTMLAAVPELREHAISRLRFVAVSATIPNVRDIATWLRVPQRGLKLYGEEMRPVKLRTLVRTYAPAKNDFLFERRLDTYLTGIVADHSAGKPTLVFCSSRKGTVDSATYLARDAGRGPRPAPTSGFGPSQGPPAAPVVGTASVYVRDAAHAERLAAAAREVAGNKLLHTCLLAGVGFHNAAMEAQHREVMERLFLAGDLPVLCSTSTLALGVNLPAHLVIIRGTRRYCGGDGGGHGDTSTTTAAAYQEYERSVCLQMVGRAGRPQFDTEGVAVIMTERENHARYANLLSGAEPVESCLHECFAEHLNAEVVLSTVRDAATATQWLRTTFLYVRVRQAPRFYGLDPPSAALATDASFDSWLAGRLVRQAVAKLAEIGLISQDATTGALRALEPGRIMAHSYLRIETMRAITQVPPNAGMIPLMRVLAMAEEFGNIRLRRGEKRVLNDINKRVEGEGAIKYPVPADGPPGAGTRGPKPKDRICKATEKIFIMINEALSDPCEANRESLDYSMRQELEGILRVGQRIAGAMTKYFSFRQAMAATANALLLAKSLRQRMWDDSTQAVRQLPDIGRLLAQRLAAAGLGGLRQLAAADPRRIEAVTQKAYPFGNTVRSHLTKHLSPEVRLSMHPHINPAQHNSQQLTLDIELSRFDDESGNGHGLRVANRTPAHLLVGCSTDDRLLRHERLTVEAFPSPYKCQVIVNLPASQRPDQTLHIVACVILERVCSLDVQASLRLSVTHGSVPSVVVSEVNGLSTTSTLADPNSMLEPGAHDRAHANVTTHRNAVVGDDAALQPSPYHAAHASGQGERCGAVGVSGAAASSALGAAERAGASQQQRCPAPPRGRKDKALLPHITGTSGAASAPASTLALGAARPHVMTQAPPLAAPAFAFDTGFAEEATTPLPQQQRTAPVPPLCPSSVTPPSLTMDADGGSTRVGAAAKAPAGSKRAPQSTRGSAKQPGLRMSGKGLLGAIMDPAFARLMAGSSKTSSPPKTTGVMGDGAMAEGSGADADAAGGRGNIGPGDSDPLASGAGVLNGISGVRHTDKAHGNEQDEYNNVNNLPLSAAGPDASYQQDPGGGMEDAAEGDLWGFLGLGLEVDDLADSTPCGIGLHANQDGCGPGQTDSLSPDRSVVQPERQAAPTMAQTPSHPPQQPQPLQQPQAQPQPLQQLQAQPQPKQQQQYSLAQRKVTATYGDKNPTFDPRGVHAAMPPHTATPPPAAAPLPGRSTAPNLPERVTDTADGFITPSSAAARSHLGHQVPCQATQTQQPYLSPPAGPSSRSALAASGITALIQGGLHGPRATGILQRPGLVPSQATVTPDMDTLQRPQPTPVGAAAASRDVRPEPFSQATILSERKKRMLVKGRDRDVAAGLQMMQHRQGRGAEGAGGGAAQSGLASRHQVSSLAASALRYGDEQLGGLNGNSSSMAACSPLSPVMSEWRGQQSLDPGTAMMRSMTGQNPRPEAEAASRPFYEGNWECSPVGAATTGLTTSAKATYDVTYSPVGPAGGRAAGVKGWRPPGSAARALTGQDQQQRPHVSPMSRIKAGNVGIALNAGSCLPGPVSVERCGSQSQPAGRVASFALHGQMGATQGGGHQSTRGAMWADTSGAGAAAAGGGGGAGRCIGSNRSTVSGFFAQENLCWSDFLEEPDGMANQRLTPQPRSVSRNQGPWRAGKVLVRPYGSNAVARTPVTKNTRTHADADTTVRCQVSRKGDRQVPSSVRQTVSTATGVTGPHSAQPQTAAGLTGQDWRQQCREEYQRQQLLGPGCAGPEADASGVPTAATCLGDIPVGGGLAGIPGAGTAPVEKLDGRALLDTGAVCGDADGGVSANRYSALVKLTQGLRKRKAQPVAEDASQRPGRAALEILGRPSPGKKMRQEREQQQDGGAGDGHAACNGAGERPPEGRGWCPPDVQPCQRLGGQELDVGPQADMGPVGIDNDVDPTDEWFSSLMF